MEFWIIWGLVARLTRLQHSFSFNNASLLRVHLPGKERRFEDIIIFQ